MARKRTGLDFNDADQHQFGDLIPNGTICRLIMTIRPGGHGPEGWLTESKTSDAQYINCEFTVLDGPFARRKVWQNLTFSGGKTNDRGQSIGGEITRAILRAMLESARNILPADMTEKAIASRRVQTFQEFNGLSFVAKIGIEKGKDGYADKNKISFVITPDKKEFLPAMSGQYSADPAQRAPAQQKPAWATGSAPASQAPQAPASPQWAAPAEQSDAQEPPPSVPVQTNIPTWAK